MYTEKTLKFYNAIPHISTIENLRKTSLTGGWIYLESNVEGTGFYFGQSNKIGKIDDPPLVILSDNNIVWIKQSFYLGSKDSSPNSIESEINTLNAYTTTSEFYSRITNIWSLSKITLASQPQVSTTSIGSSFVATGQGLLYTPFLSGRVKISIGGTGSSSVQGDGTNVGINAQLATALTANGTALNGNGNGSTTTVPGGGYGNIGMVWWISGLTLNQQYAFQTVFSSYSGTGDGATASMTLASLILEEI